jgi:hypothetical protein
MSTGSRTPNTEAGEWRSSRASSTAPPHKRDISSVVTSSEVSLQQSSTSQSPDVEAGTFILPDPLPSRARVVTTPVTVGSYSATPTGSTCGVVADEIATELCGSPRQKSVRGAKIVLPVKMATSKEGEHLIIRDSPASSKNYPISASNQQIPNLLRKKTRRSPMQNSNLQEFTLLCVKQNHKKLPTMSK